jgi:lycopene cyclase domain-containing protein
VTYRGDWAFNKDYLMGLKIAGLPIEEILFFVVVPYSCIFIYENLNHFFNDKAIPYNKWFYYLLSIIFIFIGVFFNQQEYTVLAMFSVAFFFLIASTWFPDLLQSRNFWIYLLISFFAFIIFNYLLTSIPIVTYNPEAIWGGTVQQVWNGRFITIPYEDFFYNFSMLSFYLLVYRHFKNKKSLMKLKKAIKK